MRFFFFVSCCFWRERERNQKSAIFFDFVFLSARSARANFETSESRTAHRRDLCIFRVPARSLTLKKAHLSTKELFSLSLSLSLSLSYLSTKETRDAADAADDDDGERHHHSLLREQNRVLDWRDDVVFNATCASGDDEDDDDDDDDDEKKKKKKERNANERRERRRKWVRLARRPDSEEVFASSAERESRLLLHRRVADIESFDFHHSETFSPRGWERYRSERTHELRGVDDVGERGERYERDRERRANESEESV